MALNNSVYKQQFAFSKQSRFPSLTSHFWLNYLNQSFLIKNKPLSLHNLIDLFHMGLIIKSFFRPASEKIRTFLP